MLKWCSNIVRCRLNKNNEQAINVGVTLDIHRIVLLYARPEQLWPYIKKNELSPNMSFMYSFPPLPRIFTDNFLRFPTCGDCERINGVAEYVINAFPNMMIIAVTTCDFKIVLDVINRPHLKHVSCYDSKPLSTQISKLKYDALPYLIQCTNLRSLLFGGSLFMNYHLEPSCILKFSTLKSFTFLNLNNFSNSLEMPKLRNICVHNSTWLPYKYKDTLTSLSIYYFDDIVSLDQFVGLRKLALRNIDAKLPDLSALINLRILTLIFQDSMLWSFGGTSACDNNDLSCLKGCINLRKLHIVDNCVLKSFDGLENCTGLRTLMVEGCHCVSNIKAVQKLLHLTYIHLDFVSKCENRTKNYTCDITVLSGLINLRVLNMVSCPTLIDLEFLGEHRRIEYINISHCKNLVRIGDLEKCINLKKITIGSCNALAWRELIGFGGNNMKHYCVKFMDL